MSTGANVVQEIRPSAPERVLSRADRLIGGLIALLLVIWSVHLWPQWLHNPDLAHGLFTPIVFIILLRESRERDTRRYLPTSVPLVGAIGAIGALGLLLLVGAGLYAAALEWNHALVEFLLAGALCTLLTAAWLTAALDRVRAVPFNWAAAVAILVWALSAPIPPGTYTRLTQSLQSSVTEAVLTSLQLIGVAAVRDGNVIHLAHTSVGVEEACSGVRSLLSCVFAGFFLSATLVRVPWKRVVIIVLAGPLAIAMNFVRSLSLTLLANGGVDIHGLWHDLTGFAVLGVTATLLAALALFLERGSAFASRTNARVVSQPRDGDSQVRVARVLLIAMLGSAFALLVVFVANTHSTSSTRETPPNLLALLPDQNGSWTVSTRDDLYHFTSQLQTNFLAERTYRREDDKGVAQVTVYIAYWAAGQASVSLVAAHTPDACWPGSGWVEDREPHRTANLHVGEIPLREAQFRSFHFETYPQYVWYWHLVGGKTFNEEVGSPWKLLSLAWHYGFQAGENQVFARISSNRPWEEISRDPLLKDVVTRLQTVGL